MRSLVFGFLAAAAFARPAGAVTVTPCSADTGASSVEAIAEPWEAHSRTFSNGAIRVAVVDTEEPVCCSFHLLILSPSGEKEMQVRACTLVNDHDTTGFFAVDLARLTTSYDPRKGLLLTFPYRLYDDGSGPGKPGLGKVRVNSATGRVTAEK